MPIPPAEPARIDPPHPSSRGGHALWARSVLRLQQTVGNREVLRLMGQSQPAPPRPTVPADRNPQNLPVVASMPEGPARPAASWRIRVLAAMRRLWPRNVPKPESDTIDLLEDKR